MSVATDANEDGLCRWAGCAGARSARGVARRAVSTALGGGRGGAGTVRRLRNDTHYGGWREDGKMRRRLHLQLEEYVSTLHLRLDELIPDWWEVCPACEGIGCATCDRCGRVHPNRVRWIEDEVFAEPPQDEVSDASA